jgi:hypothetical protein
MLKFYKGVAAIAVLLWTCIPYAYGQKSTEMFIPIGQSPGLSQKVTVIGTIETINSGNQTISIAGTSGTANAQITDHTWIWLDRSKILLTNQYGTFDDLRKGNLVEVKYAGSESKSAGPAEWIKVEVTATSVELGEKRQ